MIQQVTAGTYLENAEDLHQFSGDLVDRSLHILSGIFQFPADLDLLRTVLFAFSALNTVGGGG